MSELLTTVAVLFIIAGPFLLIADWFDFPAVPFLIIAGILAGALVIEEDALLLELARYGVALLVFDFGLRIQLDEIRTVLADSELAALGHIFIAGSLGTGFGFVLGVPLEQAVFLGVAVALSSTMVGTALSKTELNINLVRGRLADSINFVEDLVAVGIILVVGAGTLAPDPVAIELGYGVMLLIGALIVNRYLFSLVGRLASGSDELMIVGVVSLLVLFLGAAELAGISIVIGAFAAGIAVRHEPGEYLGLFTGLESIKDFFIAIFFVTVGALVVVPFFEMPAAASIEKLLIASGLIIFTVLIKPVITVATLLYQGYEARTATLTALTTDQVSEFALIIAIEALLLGLLAQSVFDAIIFAAAVTMVTSSLTHRYDEQIYRWLAGQNILPTRHRKVDELSHVSEDISDHAIIVGYGRTGRQLVETYEEMDEPYVVIENDLTRRDEIAAKCDQYIFGDAMNQYVWEKANADEANIIISTTLSERMSKRLLEFDFDPDLILRATEQRTALELLDAGATYVIVSDLLAGEQLIKKVREVLDDDVSSVEPKFH